MKQHTFSVKYIQFRISECILLFSHGYSDFNSTDLKSFVIFNRYFFVVVVKIPSSALKHCIVISVKLRVKVYNRFCGVQ